MKSIFFVKYFSLLLSFFCLLFDANLSAQNNQIDSLLQVIQKLEKSSGGIASDTNLINCYLTIADEYYNLQDPKKEQAYTQEALKLISKLLKLPGISKQLKNYLLGQQAVAYDNIGSYYGDINDYPKALEFYFNALKIDEGINNKKGIKRHLINIAITFGDIGEHEKSIDYNLRALALSKALNVNATIYENIGSEYYYLSKDDIALTYYFKALGMYQDQKDTLGIQMVLGNIANAYKSLGDKKLSKNIPIKDIAEYFTATVYYKKALDLFHVTGSKRNKAINLSNFGSLCLSMKKYDDAKSMLTQSLVLSVELSDLSGIMETEELLSKLYANLGDNKRSFESYKKFIAAKDSIFNKENTKRNVQTEMNFEFEKKDAIQKAEHEKAVIALEAENRIQKNTRNFIILLSLMLLLLVASGFVYFNNRKSLKLRELYGQQLHISQEKERQRISKELHDSIGQNILFIKNQMIKNNDLRLMSFVDETLEEVRNISKDLYPNQLEKYGLIAAVDALSEKVKETSDIFVSHDLEAFQKNIASDKLINYYRIIQECVSNVMKHADATALRISSRRINENIELVIQDNGKGFDKLIMVKKAQRSFGMLNLEERAKYLKGKFELETSPGKGTKYIFTFPDSNIL